MTQIHTPDNRPTTQKIDAAGEGTETGDKTACYAGRKVSKTNRFIVSMRSIKYKLKHFFLNALLNRKVISVSRLSSNRLKTLIYESLDQTLDALKEGDAPRLLSSIQNAKQAIVNFAKKEGKQYGIDNFSQWTSQWLDHIKQQNPDKWHDIHAQVSDSTTKLSKLSAAIESLNGNLDSDSINQHTRISLGTTFVYTMARAVLNSPDAGKSPEKSPGNIKTVEKASQSDSTKTVIEPYPYWDGSQNDSGLYQRILQSIRSALSKI